MIRNTNNSRQAGFSLVEVLIALVIMSVGMLGIAGLYVQGMQAGRTSMFRHQAVTLAGDVADRIRANPSAGIAYQDAVAAPSGCVDGGKDCTPAEMAAHDKSLWDAQAGGTLPRGTVAIVFTAAAGGAPPTYQITVGWDEPGIRAGDANPSYVITIPVLDI